MFLFRSEIKDNKKKYKDDYLSRKELEKCFDSLSYDKDNKNNDDNNLKNWHKLQSLKVVNTITCATYNSLVINSSFFTKSETDFMINNKTITFNADTAIGHIKYDVNSGKVNNPYIYEPLLLFHGIKDSINLFMLIYAKTQLENLGHEKMYSEITLEPRNKFSADIIFNEETIKKYIICEDIKI